MISLIFALAKVGIFKINLRNFFESLEKIAHAGANVVYLHGNHEFALDSLPWTNIKVVRTRDYILKYKGKKLAFVMVMI